MRPTQEQEMSYAQLWKTICDAHGASDRVGDLRLRAIFVAGCFLEEKLLEAGALPAYRFKQLDLLKRLCFAMDATEAQIWGFFDVVWDSSQVDGKFDSVDRLIVGDDASIVVTDDWFQLTQKMWAAGRTQPHILIRRRIDARVECHVMALVGQDAYEYVADVLSQGWTDEFIFGVCTDAQLGQGIRLDEFMIVIHYANGQFRPGVLEYQHDDTDPVFGPICWDNEFWNQELQTYPIPLLRAAMTRQPCGDA